MLEDLPRCGIRWTLLGTRGEPERGARDVDLLVDRRDLRPLHLLLGRHGFVRRHVRGPNRLYVAYEHDAARWHVLDVATHVRLGPHRVRAGHLLDHRRRRGPFFTLDPDDAFWLQILEALAHRSVVPPHDRQTLQMLAHHAGVSSDLARLATWWAAPGSMATTLRAAARDGDWESLTGAARRCRPRATSPGAALVDAVRQPLVRLGRRLRCVVPRRGISLAIVGPDGAGKSTLAASLVAGSALPARAFYMGLHAPVGGAAPMSADSRSRRPLPIRLRRQVRRLLRLTRTALRSELARARGQLVVFDRYTYDADVQWQQARGPGVRLRRWLVRHCARQPDLVVVLDVPASVMFARKREHTHELLEERRLRYLALADTSDRFTVLDGTRPAEELYRIATSLLWNRYVELSASRTIARDGLRAQRREQRRVRERARATEATPAATEARGGARTQP